MSTRFTFPKEPKIGDRLEIVSISDAKLPIEIFANPEAEKPLKLIFPDIEYTATAGGNKATEIATSNITYCFKCVSVADYHTWLLEDTALYDSIKALEARLTAIEARITALENANASTGGN